MLIDTHTHAFPDAIAQKAIASLQKTAGAAAAFDGTVAGLKALLLRDGVDRAFLLNTATNARQVDNVNKFALSLLGDQMLIPFCSFHPLADSPYEKLKGLKDAGIKGIKLHPDYIGIALDDEAMSPLLSAITELGLPLVIHAGFDPYSPNVIHASPDMILRVLDRYPGIILIAAHLGGIRVWDEVREKLCGKDLYLDTAFCCERNGITRLQAKRIFDSHPREKILFGSDAPWATPSEVLHFVKSIVDDGETLEMITHGNAERLLGL